MFVNRIPFWYNVDYQMTTKINSKVISCFKDIGLGEKEALVYIAVLRNGASGASEIEKNTGINRTSAYHQIKNLVDAGMLKEVMNGNKNMYVAIDPDDIKYIANKRKKELRGEIDKWDEISHEFPGVINRYKSIDDGYEIPKPRIFTGIEGIKDSYRHILDNANKDLLSCFSVVEAQQPELQEFFTNEFAPRRAKKKIFSKNITPITEKTEMYDAKSNDLNMEVRFLDSESFPLTNVEKNIYEDYIHYMHFNDKGGFAYIIESVEMASVERFIFNKLWNELGRNISN